MKKYGIYVHVPFCKAKCKYCAFSSVTDFSLCGKYLETLTAEIDSAPERGACVDTVYFGGGTPSCLPRGAIARLLSAIKKKFDVSQTAEITAEANPESVDESFAEECKSAGVNRISMGLQSADDRVLRDVGRIHTCGDFLKAAELLKKTGFDNISSDLILGLPNQNISDVDTAVSVMSEYCVHASVYALTVEDGTALASAGYYPDDDDTANFYDRACECLAKKGFSRYEVSNFAKRGCESRHNKKYWNCEPYIGFGAAAHGYDGDGIRYAHCDGVTEYIKDPRRKITRLSETDKFNEYIMLRLRTEEGIRENDFLTRFGHDFSENNPTLERLIKEGAMCFSGGRYYISPEKMFVMNGIIVDLMR